MKSRLYILLILVCTGCRGQNRLILNMHKMSENPKHFHISTKNQEQLIPFHNKNGQWGYLNAKTDAVVIQPQYSRADLFKNGIAKVYQPNPTPKTYADQSLTGFIDTQGNEIFAPQFTGVYEVEIKGNRNAQKELADLRFVYKNDGTTGVISLKTGEWLFTLNKDGRVFFYDRTHFTVDDRIFYHDGVQTVLPSPVKIDWIYFSPDFIRVKNKAGASGLYSWEGKKILPAKYLDLSIDSVTQRIVASRLRGGTTLGNLKRLINQGNENAKNIKVDLLDFNGQLIKTFNSQYQGELTEDQMGFFETDGKTTYFSLKTGAVVTQREKAIKILPNGSELFQENGKTGLRTADGQIRIPAEYRRIHYIDSTHLLVQTQDLHYQVYDIQGNNQFGTTYSEMVYLPDLKRFMVTKGNNAGQIDMNGKVVIPLKYSGFSSLFLTKKPPYAVNKEGKRGVIDRNGKTIVPFEYNRIEDTRRRDSTEVPFFILTKNKKVGLMDQHENWLLPMEYGYIYGGKKQGDGYWFKLEAYPRNKNKYGLFNTQTKVLIPPTYDNISVYDHFIIAANRKDNTYFHRLLDLSGRPLTDSVYTEMELTHGYLLCRKKGKYGVLSTTGKELLPFDYKYIWAKTNHLIYVQTENDEYYMDISGKSYKAP